MAQNLQGLRWDEHGTQDNLPVLSIATDREVHPYRVVLEVPFDPFNAQCRIVAVGDRPEALHTELVLVSGERVACWDRAVIEPLWKFGLPVTVYPTLVALVADRLELKRKKRPMGYPALYVLD